MPYWYYFDEKHIREWLNISKTPEGVQEYLDKYVFGVKDFEEYLEKVGGVRNLSHLRQVEQLRAPLPGAEG
jgi:3-oxoacid CoA-transferase subunit A/glutaconate CoA-transferase subunit A